MWHFPSAVNTPQGEDILAMSAVQKALLTSECTSCVISDGSIPVCLKSLQLCTVQLSWMSYEGWELRAFSDRVVPPSMPLACTDMRISVSADWMRNSGLKAGLSQLVQCSWAVGQVLNLSRELMRPLFQGEPRASIPVVIKLFQSLGVTARENAFSLHLHLDNLCQVGGREMELGRFGSCTLHQNHVWQMSSTGL